ncbi:hypothetical protein [Collinsella stercoris]|uniref:Uncharacterized protein n=1 Tax=Collinsella stercoris DSM 13279 TaxID=445975 RepID=B6G8G4_9ACTN|nr:hypothetical protein [Collinsella stercoris]EEA91428.1 hypothetical protein COLSTE_00342 [Collinsella stercoris DSM 13279]UEA44781.1 hypothetical protein LK434_06415 [Collinsella stercoris DSM 13279]UWP10752.1 hypothetical protein NQ498_05590 [Collinsella stercoris]
MPAGWSFAIIYVMVFGFAIYIGFLLGDGWGKRIVTAKAYWLCNLGMLVCSVLLVSLVPLPLVQVGAMGVLAGGIAGLKMGFGESTGPWKWLDSFMNVNRHQRKVAEKGTGEAYRRRRKTGEAGPDLISVDKKGPSSRS